jgi:hypothetical protein
MSSKELKELRDWIAKLEPEEVGKRPGEPQGHVGISYYYDPSYYRPIVNAMKETILAEIDRRLSGKGPKQEGA